MAQNFDVFILCGGKSGSSTLDLSFSKNGFKSLKVHGRLDYIEQFKEDKLFESIELSSTNKRIYIIDVYRNPIERKISSFFQNIDIFVPGWKSKTNEELINIFNKKHIYKLEEYHSINEAFDYFNLPRFKEFDFQKKFNICEFNNKVFIKLLHKNINIWNFILRYIFKKNFIISNNNLSIQKDYYKTYKNFLLLYKVPKKYLNKLKTKDQEFRIYNSPNEQKEYLNYWSDRSIE